MTTLRPYRAENRSGGPGSVSGEGIRLVSVNVGRPTPLGEIRGDRVWSGIRKRPVDPATVLWLSRINLAGDGQADLDVHGGLDKAVYATRRSISMSGNASRAEASGTPSSGRTSAPPVSPRTT